jgi:hypothetical protein
MHENREISCTSWPADQERVREGHKPSGGRERAGEVGLCRTTSEPAEQRRAAAFRGGRGGKGTDSGEHRSITHAPDTERETHVPGIARCATSSKRKEAGTVHCSAPPSERRITPWQLYALKRQASPGVDGVTSTPEASSHERGRCLASEGCVGLLPIPCCPG